MHLTRKKLRFVIVNCLNAICKQFGGLGQIEFRDWLKQKHVQRALTNQTKDSLQLAFLSNYHGAFW